MRLMEILRRMTGTAERPGPVTHDAAVEAHIRRIRERQHENNGRLQRLILQRSLLERHQKEGNP